MDKKKSTSIMLSEKGITELRIKKVPPAGTVGTINKSKITQSKSKIIVKVQ